MSGASENPQARERSGWLVQPDASALDTIMGDRGAVFFQYLRVVSPVAVVLVILWIEGGRRAADPVPIPFLLLYASVIIAASAGGLRGGLIGGALAAAFVAYAAEVGFGPPTLTGGASNVVLGIALFALSGGIVGFRTDRRQRDLRILKRSAEVSLSDALAEGFILLDATGTILESNDQFARLVGVSPDSVRGRRVTRGDLGITYLNDDGTPANVAELPLARAIATGRPQQDHLTAVRRPDGSVIQVRLNTAPEAGTDTPEYFVTTVTDVTARVEAERELARLNLALAQQSGERQALVRQLLTAQEDERQTIAYEIHDGPAQKLAAAQMFLEAYEHEVQQAAQSDYFAQARDHLGTGLKETRRIMSGLRPALLDDVGLLEAIHTLVTDATTDTNVQVEFQSSEFRDGMPPEVEITLYRVVQEAVNNALKHSNSSSLSIRLQGAPHVVSATVEDRGVGFIPADVPAPREGRYFGLVGMRERVALLGGQLTIDSEPGDGTVVSVTIPLPRSA